MNVPTMFYKPAIPPSLVGLDRIAWALAKIPADKLPIVDNCAANFISGMEAAFRANRPSTDRPGAE